VTDSLEAGVSRSELVGFRAELNDFGDFYERTYDSSYRTAVGIVRDRALAADVTQDAYVAAYRHRNRFRGEAPSTAWLHRIIVNESLGALRRRRPTAAIVDMSSSISPEGSAQSLARLDLFQALELLPPQHRAAVILRYYHEHDYATIARILNTTSTNVGAMLSRALDRLRVVLEQTPGALAGREG
jgi:RNA polymerase sigma-70 factor (ECF subfamily)